MEQAKTLLEATKHAILYFKEQNQEQFEELRNSERVELFNIFNNTVETKDVRLCDYYFDESDLAEISFILKNFKKDGVVYNIGVNFVNYTAESEAELLENIHEFCVYSQGDGTTLEKLKLLLNLLEGNLNSDN